MTVPNHDGFRLMAAPLLECHMEELVRMLASHCDVIVGKYVASKCGSWRGTFVVDWPAKLKKVESVAPRASGSVASTSMVVLPSRFH